MNDRELWLQWVAKCLTHEVGMERVYIDENHENRNLGLSNMIVTFPDGRFHIQYNGRYVDLSPSPHPMKEWVRELELDVKNDVFLTDNIDQFPIDDFLRMWLL